MAVMKKTEQTGKPAAKAPRNRAAVKPQGKNPAGPEKAEKPAAKSQKPARRFNFGGFKRAREFFQGVVQELKKVHWLNRRETLIYTAVVVVSVVVVGLIIWIADSILSTLVQLILT
ncbi:MAG: preprotein translocase subunit SecE [Bacillota bacterium]